MPTLSVVANPVWLSRSYVRITPLRSLIPLERIGWFIASVSPKGTDAMPRKKTESQAIRLRVVDENQRPLRGTTTVNLRSVREEKRDYKASSKAGIVTEYSLDIPPGEYDLAVVAKSYLPHRSRISVKRESAQVITVTLYRKYEPEKGNAVERAHAWLSDIRSYPEKRIPLDAREKAIAQKRNPPPPPGPPPPPDRAKWTVLGPRNISGRVRALAAHPTDGDTIFAGSANAGVWVTHNSARTWRSLWFDEEVLEIGALAIHLTDPKKPDGDVTLYAGTGTIEFGGPTLFPAYPGVGIYKSDQSGEQGTWVKMPVPLTDMTAIVVDPNSLSGGSKAIVLYAGGSGGLYQSQNGGSTWTPVTTSKNIRSLALDPSDTKWLYAGVAQGGIVQINRMTLAINDFNSNVASRPYSMMIAIGQSSPFTMYAKYDDTVYRYNRNTKQWKNLGAHGGSTYGFWNECLGVDPKNPKIVLSGGTGLERSSDSGDNWTDVALDSDHHAVAFSSSDSLIVYVGNDHGVRKGFYLSPEVGAWEKTHNGLILTHYNGLGASGIGPNVIGGGSQDNGTHRTVGGLTWDNLRGGDGGGFLYDPDDPYTMYYAESYALGDPDNGDIYRTTNGGVSDAQADTSGFQGPFVTPLVIDPTSPKAHRILFAGGTNKVQRSSNGGMSWSASSPNVGGEVRSLSVSPRSSAVMYAGTDVGSVWRSTNGGATTANWKQITPGTGAPLPNRRLTSVMADPLHTFGVYVTFGGLNAAGNGNPGHLFYGLSKDGNSYNWENRSGNLPDIPAYSVAIDPGNPPRMWIGTDIGVFESNDGAVSWLGDDGLPNVVVTELTIRKENDVLRAATYGWGMWQRRIQPPYSPVDVYVRDNKMDTGETRPSPYNVVDPQVVGNKLFFWESPDIKVSLSASPPKDGVEFDLLEETAPLRGVLNPLYIQVHNRGWNTATNVKVKVLWAAGATGLPKLPSDFWSSFPGNWSAASNWKPIDANVPFQTISKLLPHTPAILKWTWLLPLNASDDSCVLVVISADQDPVTRSDANPDDRIVDTVSVWDKHVAHRNLHIKGLKWG